MIGFISLHRSIRDNWIYKKPEYLKAWIDILLLVNFEEKKVEIHGEIFTCKRGDALYSLSSWADIFGGKWTVKKVRTFFKLLETEKMISYSGIRKTTRLSVVNYGTYQTEGQTKGRQRADKGQQLNKDNKDNKKDMLDLFNNFRKKYPGRKKGNEVEFEIFSGKLKKYINIIPDLEKILDKQIKQKELEANRGDFVPQWKNLSTWLNQKCWTEEIEDIKKQEITFDHSNYEMIKQQSSSPEDKAEAKRKLDESRKEAKRIMEEMEIAK